MPAELLSVEPNELRFPFELKKQINCSVRLVNNTDSYVAFKVKTTSPKKYCVRPNTGLVLPRSSCEVIFTMQAQREAPADSQSKDKFLVQSVVATHGTAAKDITQDMFNRDNGQEVYEAKLKVVFVPPHHPPSPVPEASEDDSSPTAHQASSIDHVFGSFETSKDVNELQAKLTEAKKALAKLSEECDTSSRNNQQLRQDIKSLRIKSNVQSRSTVAVKPRCSFSLRAVFIIVFLSILFGYLIGRRGSPAQAPPQFAINNAQGQ